MAKALLWSVALLSLLSPIACPQDDPDILFKADFEKDLSGLSAPSPAARLSITTDPNFVFAGGGSLQLWFQQPDAGTPDNEAMPGLLVCPLPAPLADAKAISFAVSAQVPTAFAVVLSEGEEGPRYIEIIWCEGDLWDEVVIPLSELRADPDGPEDPNGRLDPAEVSGLIFVDIGRSVGSGPESAPFYKEPPAEQTIWLDDLQVLGSVPPDDRPKMPDNEVLIGDYRAPLRGALLLGGKDLAVEYEPLDDGECLKLTYSLPAKTLLAVVHIIPRGLPAGARSIRLQVKAAAETQLVIALEERPLQPGQESPSYSHLCRIAAGAPWTSLDIPLSEFEPEGGKTDPDGKLTVERIQTVVIGDAGSVVDGQATANTLWLGGLVAVR